MGKKIKIKSKNEKGTIQMQQSNVDEQPSTSTENQETNETLPKQKDEETNKTIIKPRNKTIVTPSIKIKSVNLRAYKKRLCNMRLMYPNTLDLTMCIPHVWTQIVRNVKMTSEMIDSMYTRQGNSHLMQWYNDYNQIKMSFPDSNFPNPVELFGLVKRVYINFKRRGVIPTVFSQIIQTSNVRPGLCMIKTRERATYPTRPDVLSQVEDETTLKSRMLEGKILLTSSVLPEQFETWSYTSMNGTPQISYSELEEVLKARGTADYQFIMTSTDANCLTDFDSILLPCFNTIRVEALNDMVYSHYNATTVEFKVVHKLSATRDIIDKFCLDIIDNTIPLGQDIYVNDSKELYEWANKGVASLNAKLSVYEIVYPVRLRPLRRTLNLEYSLDADICYKAISNPNNWVYINQKQIMVLFVIAGKGMGKTTFIKQNKLDEIDKLFITDSDDYGCWLSWFIKNKNGIPGMSTSELKLFLSKYTVTELVDSVTYYYNSDRSELQSYFEALGRRMVLDAVEYYNVQHSTQMHKITAKVGDKLKQLIYNVIGDKLYGMRTFENGIAQCIASKGEKVSMWIKFCHTTIENSTSYGCSYVVAIDPIVDPISAILNRKRGDGSLLEDNIQLILRYAYNNTDDRGTTSISWNQLRINITKALNPNITMLEN